jgi:pilus assembly protein CpaF
MFFKKEPPAELIIENNPVKVNTEVKEQESRPQQHSISESDRRIKKNLLEELFNSLDLSLIETLDRDQAKEQIFDAASTLLLDQNVPLNADARIRIINEIIDEILGLGPLEPLLKDPTISDILVNGHASIYIEWQGKLEATEAQFRDDAHLLNVIDRIVSLVGRRIDESSPMVDARLKDGSRVNAIIPPLAIDGLFDVLRLKSWT